MRRIFFIPLLISFLTVNAQKHDTAKFISELKAHLFYLASDNLAGRYPGTKGGQLASEYIHKQFNKTKINLTINKGFQPFDFISNVEPTSANALSIKNFKPKYEKDFITYPYSVSDTICNSVVFAGFGIEFKNDSLSWDDYAGIDVKGKAVLILRGDPDYEKNISPYFKVSSERTKVLLAKEKGATAVIFVSPVMVDKKDDFYSLRNYQGDAGIAVIQVKRSVADSILKPANVTLSEIDQKIKATKGPLSFNIENKVNLITGLTFKKSVSKNVIAILPGNDPKLKDEYIVIGAHYDHLGMGGRGSSSTKQDTMAVHHGADDNASGVTAILGIARKITTLKQPLKRSLIFIAFDGEEEGLLGSKYYVNNPVIPLGKTMVMLNFDMVGRLKEDKTLQLAGTGTAAESDSILKSILTGFNFKSTFDPGGTGPSDYASFYGKNIPVISFTTGVHPDYHTPEDKPEKINYQGLSEIINLSTKLITELANRDKPLTYKQVSSPSETRNVRRGKVSLGIMPDFSGAEKNGLRVDGVTKGKPADKAGVLKDDIITAINGAPIKDIYEYMYQMGKCNQGDKIIVEIKRNEKLIKLEVEL